MKNKLIHTPEGVRDIYGSELSRKIIIKNKLHDTLHLYGYRDIETPSFEYSDIYHEVGTTPDNEMYRFFDNNGNMLVLRPDFTPSIARCAAKYFLEDSMPIRLCYEGSAFINTSDLQGKLKEITQMGAELIDERASSECDGEMVCLIIESLLNVGFKDFQVCLGNAMFFKGMCEMAGLDEDQIITLSEYISIKNYFGAIEYLTSINADENLKKYLLEITDITNFEDLDKIKNLKLSDRSLEALEGLAKVYDVIKLNGYDKYVSLDLGLISKFNYYTGIIFKAYTYGTGDAIVKGGRYDKLLDKFGKKSAAVGFVFLVDDIMSALSAQGALPEFKRENIWICYNLDKREQAYKRAKELRSEGKNVTLALKSPDKTKDEYEIYKEKNKITNIEYILD